MSPLPAGSTIGILGGGQLGRMLASAAAQLGFDVNIFCPGDSPPAARVAAGHWDADYDDHTALEDFAANCDVITYEFENIPVASVAHLVSCSATVRPGAKSLEVSQDRLAEKQFLNAIGIETGRFEPVESVGQLETALQALGGDIGIGLRREFGPQVIERGLGHLFPRSVARQQAVGRGVRDRRFRPRADHALHQHPFGLAPRCRRPLDPPETLDQERLEAAQGLGAGIGTEREFACQGWPRKRASNTASRSAFFMPAVSSTKRLRSSRVSNTHTQTLSGP